MRRRHFLSLALAGAVGAGVERFAQAASERKLRVAAIGHTGHGAFGHDLDLVWSRLSQTEVVAVADADPAGLAARQKKLGPVEGFADYRRMLSMVKPDIVAICPRFVDERREMVLAAIESGAKGIHLEKPFCRTPAEADELVAACQRGNVKLALALRNRYHPALPVAAKLVADGAIGQVVELRARGKEDHRGGALDLWVLGPHVLNLCVYFAGKPLMCSASLLQDGRPTTRADLREGAEGVGLIAGNAVHARFEMERGAPAFFDSVIGAGVAKAGFGVQIVGTDGVVDLRMDTEPMANLLAGNPFQPTSEARAWTPISSAGLGKPEPIADLKAQMAGHFPVALDLLAAIADDRPPLCSAADGRTTVEMISAVFESHRFAGRRVTFPLTTRENPLGLPES